MSETAVPSFRAQAQGALSNETSSPHHSGNESPSSSRLGGAHCDAAALEVPQSVGAQQFTAQAQAATETVKVPTLGIVTVCKSLLAGGIAGGVSRSAVAPLERLKILQQVQDPLKPKYNGTLSGLRTIFQAEGLRGFFKGNGTNCMRIIPNSAVKFYAYEQASHAFLWALQNHGGQPDAELSPLLRLAAGATAGIIAMSATYPMDMVRGRLTVQVNGPNQRYKGMLHAMKTVAKEEGPRALYKGWLPSVIGVVPYVGLNFAVYETLKDWVQKAQPDPSTDLSVVTKLACGAAAGTVGQTVAYPLDVVRRRMQMIGWRDADAQGVFHEEAAALKKPGMVDTFRLTVKHEGVRALYKGLVPNSLKVVPSIAIAFVTYEMMKDLMGVEVRISE